MVNHPDLNLPHPLLIVISGPSGVGKDSVVQSLKRRGLPFHFVVTATTRPRRENEVHGRDYFFVTKEEFERMIKSGELLEYATVYDDYKGVPGQQVRQALDAGKDAVMRLDIQGAATIHGIAPEAVLIFLTVKNEAELISRLKRRQSETPESLAVRLKEVRKELQCAGDFDYIVANEAGQLEKTVDTVVSIIEAEHHRVHPRQVTL